MSDPSLSGNAPGSGQSTGSSLSALVTSLVTNTIVWGVEVGLFIILRVIFQRIYQPRAGIVKTVPEKKRVEPLPKGPWGWIPRLLATRTRVVISKSGLDGYFLLRYLRGMIIIFTGCMLILWPILLPTNSVNQKGVAGGVSGLDLLSISNVQDTWRYWIHTVAAIVFIVAVCFFIYRELKAYIRIRQENLKSEEHRNTVRATTILVTSIPDSFMDEKTIRSLFSVYPGGVKNVFFNKDYSKLTEKIEERDKIARLLEAAETELIIKAAKVKRKQDEKQGKQEEKQRKQEERQREQAERQREQQEKQKEQQEKRREQQEKRREQAERQRGEREEREAKARRENPWRRWETLWRPMIRKHHDHDRAGEQPWIPDCEVDYEYGRQQSSVEQQSAVDQQKTTEPGPETSNSSPEEHGIEQPDRDWHTDSHPDVEQERIKEPEPESSSSSRQEDAIDQSGGVQPNVEQQKIKEPGSRSPNSSREDHAREQLDRDWHRDLHPDHKWLVNKYVKYQDRPKYRPPLFNWMPSLPLIGRQEDTIEWARMRLSQLNLHIQNEQNREINRTNDDQQDGEINKKRRDLYPMCNSAFIQFNTQLAAHMACQCVASRNPMYLAPRFLETAPEDIVWDNMQFAWWHRLLRVYLINSALLAVIIFYAIPTAFVGTISNITYLTQLLPWLGFINNLPDKLLGIITGLLPSIMLAVWLSLIPFILRFACRYQSYPTRTAIELAVQDLYFVFLVIQLFLVVSIASSTTAVIGQILENPTSIANILATNLPKASNFFFSYLLLQGLSVSAGTLLQIVILLLYYGLKTFDKTPREKWKRFNTLVGLGWGTTYPVFTNLAVIGLSYAIIAPMILVFLVVTFCLFYFTYLYNFLNVYEFTTDTGGLAYPKALYQTMTGLYFAEICLAGLFFINPGGRVQGIVMVVVFFLTLLYHYQLWSRFRPLIEFLPVDIQDQIEHKAQEQERADRGGHSDEEASYRDAHSVHEPSSTSSPPYSPKDHDRQQLPRRPSTQNLDEKLPPGSVASGSDMQDEKSVHSKPESHTGLWREVSQKWEKRWEQWEEKGKEKRKHHHDRDSYLASEAPRGPRLTDEQVANAFRHEALRIPEPVIWIPNDPYEIAKDECYHTQDSSEMCIRISCEGAELDNKFRVVVTEDPPDYVAETLTL